jgi:hypothetical protein
MFLLYFGVTRRTFHHKIVMAGLVPAIHNLGLEWFV